MEEERRTGRTDENAEEKTEISAAVDYEEKRDWFVQQYNRLRIGVGNDKDLQGLARCDLVGIVISQVSICLCTGAPTESISM